MCNRDAQESPLLEMVFELPQTTKALELTAFAICIARAAYTPEGPDYALIHESRKLYGQGLYAVRRALADPKLVYSDEVLVTCVLLAVYEVFECPSKGRSGYLSHYDGCAQLIKIRGPHAHREGIAHSCFLVFRIMGAFESLIRRETFLFEDRWKTVPFAVVPKAPADRLIDILLEAPAVMDLSDRLASIKAPGKLIKAVLEITDLCWDLDRKLSNFYDDLSVAANGPLFWPVLSSLSAKVQELDRQDEDDDLFSTVEYQFIDFKRATTLTYYWAICLLLHSGMCHLYGILEQLRPAIGELRNQCSESEKDAIDAMLEGRAPPPLEHRREFISLVRHICHSVQFCSQDNLGLSVITAPLDIVVGVLGAWPEHCREREWAQGALERLRRRGVNIIRYLPRG